MKPDDDLIDPRSTDDDRASRLDRAWTPGPASTGGARVLRARPALDAAAAAELRRESRALLARSADPVVVDLTAVRDVEPAAVGVLRDLAYEAGDADVDLRVARGPAVTAATRALLGDESLFEVYPTLDAALPHAGLPARDRRPPTTP